VEGLVQNMLAVWAQTWKENPATFDQHLRCDLINGLPKQFPGTIAIRDKQNCSAVGRPGGGDIAVLIECETARLFEASSARINLR